MDSGAIEIITGCMVSGKCLGKGTRVLMANGTVKNVENILSGDFVMGSYSEPVLVDSITSGIDTMYKIKQFRVNYNGITQEAKSYIVNSSHILSLKNKVYNKNYPTGQILNISVDDYVNVISEGIRMDITQDYRGYKNPVLEYHNGYKDTAFIPECKHTSLLFSSIPQKILLGSLSVRKKWLACVLEEYGIFEPEGIYFKLKNMTYDKHKFFRIIESLGFTIERANKKFQEEDYEAEDFLIRGNELQYLPWEYTQFEGDSNLRNDEFKKQKPFLFVQNERLYNIEIEKLEENEYFGFTLDDDNHLFMLADFTITHNTTELLKRLSCDAFVGKNVLFINHSSDVRNGSNFSTHNPLFKNFHVDNVNINISSYTTLPDFSEIEKYHTIGIDEGQFFTNIEKVVEYAEVYGKRVIISGLIGDSKRKLFGDMYKLMPKASKFDLIPASCMKCAEEKPQHVDAFFTHRTVSDEGQLLIGGLEKYIPVCLKHYLSLNQK